MSDHIKVGRLYNHILDSYYIYIIGFEPGLQGSTMIKAIRIVNGSSEDNSIMLYHHVDIINYYKLVNDE